MNRKEDIEIKETDHILQELWEAKDYYSSSCDSDFEILVQKIRGDIKSLGIVDIHDKVLKMDIST